MEQIIAGVWVGTVVEEVLTTFILYYIYYISLHTPSMSPAFKVKLHKSWQQSCAVCVVFRVCCTEQVLGTELSLKTSLVANGDAPLKKPAHVRGLRQNRKQKPS